MPGRKYEAQGYRYGFNGKEKDKDINSLTAYDYGFRVYNPGIGKFLSVDPLTKEYPELTPYQFASNTPIQSIDLDGLESKEVTHWITINLDGSTELKTLTKDHIKDGGTVGILSKGVLTTIHVDNRQLVKNKDYGKKGNTLPQMLNLPGKQEEYTLWQPEAKRKRGGLFLYTTGAGNSPGMGSDNGEADGAVDISGIVAAAGIMGPNGSSSELYDDVIKVWTKFAGAGKYDMKQVLAALNIIAKAADGSSDAITNANTVVEQIKKLNSGSNVKLTPSQDNSTPRIEPGSKPATIYRRLNDFGTGPNREKKGSLQDHKYITDSVERKKQSKDGRSPDTAEVRNTGRFQK